MAAVESVWDYPRPPRLVRDDRHVTVHAGAALVAETSQAYRVLETSHPPTWYLPREALTPGSLRPSRARSTVCEWKGAATYWDVVDGDGGLLVAAGWSYEHPTPGFVDITGYVAFMPTVLTCTVAGEVVCPQAGGFYGGWVTDDVRGPFKGEPGTLGW